MTAMIPHEQLRLNSEILIKASAYWYMQAWLKVFSAILDNLLLHSVIRMVAFATDLRKNNW